MRVDPDSDALALAWCAAVLASLVVPSEASAARVPTLAVGLLLAIGWAVARAVVRGSIPLPASWRAWARRPLSSRTLLVLGAAVGPILLLFLLACRRAVAAPRPDDRHP